MRIRIPRCIWDQMLARASGAAPQEICGLLGGAADTVSAHYPVENELHSTHRFRMAPQQQLNAFLAMDAQGIDLLAIYHSHPAGPPAPSETDLAEHAYPGVFDIILAPTQGKWTGSAYRLDDRKVLPVDLFILDA